LFTIKKISTDKILLTEFYLLVKYHYQQILSVIKFIDEYHLSLNLSTDLSIDLP